MSTRTEERDGAVMVFADGRTFVLRQTVTIVEEWREVKVEGGDPIWFNAGHVRLGPVRMVEKDA